MTSPRLALSLLTAALALLAGCASPDAAPKNGPDPDAFIVTNRFALVQGSMLRQGDTVCVELVSPGPDREVNDGVLKTFNRELSQLGVKQSASGCDANILLNVIDVALEHKARKYKFPTRLAMAKASEANGAASVASADMVRGGSVVPPTFDLSPFTMANKSIGIGGGSVNAGLAGAGIGFLLDVTGAHSAMNEAISGDPRGYCGGKTCRLWDHYFYSARFVAVVKRPNAPTSRIEVATDVISREASLEKVFRLAFSDFTRELSGLQPSPMKDLLPTTRATTYAGDVYNDARMLATRAEKLYWDNDAVPVAKN